MDRMGPSLILSVIHTITIGTMLNNNDGDNEHGLENVRCRQTLTLSKVLQRREYIVIYRAQVLCNSRPRLCTHLAQGRLTIWTSPRCPVRTTVFLWRPSVHTQRWRFLILLCILSHSSLIVNRRFEIVLFHTYYMCTIFDNFFSIRCSI